MPSRWKESKGLEFFIHQSRQQAEAGPNVDDLLETREQLYRNYINFWAENFSKVGKYGIPIADGTAMVYRIPIEKTKSKLDYLIVTHKGPAILSFNSANSVVNYKPHDLDGAQYFGTSEIPEWVEKFNSVLADYLNGFNIKSSIVFHPDNNLSLVFNSPSNNGYSITLGSMFSRIAKCRLVTEAEGGKIAEYLNRIQGLYDQDCRNIKSHIDLISPQKEK